MNKWITWSLKCEWRRHCNQGNQGRVGRTSLVSCDRIWLPWRGWPWVQRSWHLGGMSDSLSPCCTCPQSRGSLRVDMQIFRNNIHFTVYIYEYLNNSLLIQNLLKLINVSHFGVERYVCLHSHGAICTRLNV